MLRRRRWQRPSSRMATPHGDFQTIRRRLLGSFSSFLFSKFSPSVKLSLFSWFFLFFFVALSPRLGRFSLFLSLLYFSKLYLGSSSVLFFFVPCSPFQSSIYRTMGVAFHRGAEEWVEERVEERLSGSGCPGGPPSASAARRVVGQRLLSVAHRRGASVGGKRDLQKIKNTNFSFFPAVMFGGRRK